MAGVQLKSLREHGSGHRHRMLLELSELNGSARTRGLYLFDAALFHFEVDAAGGKKPEQKKVETNRLVDAEIPPAQAALSTEADNAFSDPLVEEATIQIQQQGIADVLFGPRLMALTGHISHVIHLSDTGKLIFLDANSWVNSIDLDGLDRSVVTTAATLAPGPRTPSIQYSRHFFVPYDWFSGTRDIVCAATARDILFARNGEIAIIKNGLDYAEEVVVGVPL
ncbi:hypothetical protein CLAIMM_09721 [Cladophialophora immunda]|nr:hypothetical protein CLAIMM_09721 [Cladophialophora immunda]